MVRLPLKVFRVRKAPMVFKVLLAQEHRVLPVRKVPMVFRAHKVFRV
jgi:hypothetical protein